MVIWIYLFKHSWLLSLYTIVIHTIAHTCIYLPTISLWWIKRLQQLHIPGLLSANYLYITCVNSLLFKTIASVVLNKRLDETVYTLCGYMQGFQRLRSILYLSHSPKTCTVYNVSVLITIYVCSSVTLKSKIIIRCEITFSTNLYNAYNYR